MGIRIGDWDWGSGLDMGMGVIFGIGNRDLGLRFGIGDWDWGLVVTFGFDFWL